MSSNEDQSLEPVPADRHAVVDLVGGEGRLLAQDLERARALLRDGMSKIAGFVSLLRQSAERAHQLASAGGDRDGVAITDALSTLQAEADQAMMGLQLEDILGQLIEGTQARVGAFSQLSTELAALVAVRPSLAPSVEKLGADLSSAQQGRERGAVAQGSLDAGDTELF
jgi:hypothetical protein